MRSRSFALGVVVSSLFVAAPAAVADSDTERFLLVTPVPNFAVAPNGDRVMLQGNGWFQVNPKDVQFSGSFTHTDSAGNVLGGGTFVATQLLTYQSYGCGVALGNPLPPNLCGGKVTMRVAITVGGQQHAGILSVFCIIGDNPPNDHDEPDEEGVRLNVIGVINFNETAPGGANVYVRITP
jgi:hypothetical protein